MLPFKVNGCASSFWNSTLDRSPLPLFPSSMITLAPSYLQSTQIITLALNTLTYGPVTSERNKMMVQSQSTTYDLMTTKPTSPSPSLRSTINNCASRSDFPLQMTSKRSRGRRQRKPQTPPLLRRSYKEFSQKNITWPDSRYARNEVVCKGCT